MFFEWFIRFRYSIKSLKSRTEDVFGVLLVQVLFVYWPLTVRLAHEEEDICLLLVPVGRLVRWFTFFKTPSKNAFVALS